MGKAVRIYVGCVIAAAVLLLATLYRAFPSVDAHALSAVLLLGSLALVSETLGYLLPRSATGSISFIPYLACVLIVPGWETVLVSAAVKGIVELFARRHPLKAVFNVAQNAVSQATAVWVYLALGGRAMPRLPDPTSLLDVTQRVGFQALTAMLVALLLNGILVSAAIALSGQTTVSQVLKDNKKATAGVDVLSGPLTFVFAWLYAGFGPIAAATLWVPVLGLRQVHKTNLELEQTNQELLELMVKSLEARDAYTSGHSRRVHQYSTIIARAIGLSERDVEHIGRAALLHDVG
jgi:hypothetical protein